MKTNITHLLVPSVGTPTRLASRFGWLGAAALTLFTGLNLHATQVQPVPSPRVVKEVNATQVQPVPSPRVVNEVNATQVQPVPSPREVPQLEAHKQHAPETIYLGNSLDVPNGGPDGIPPLVIIGEYDPAGPLDCSPVTFPGEGRVTEVEFYGADYKFTLYALHRVGKRHGDDRVTFRVVAAESFEGSAEPGIQSLAVSNFAVQRGDLLAFAGIGPFYPQNPDDEFYTDATYENSSDPTSFAATPPGRPGTEFTVGPYTDPSATYEYISDYFGNQGRVYGIGVEFQPDRR